MSKLKKSNTNEKLLYAIDSLGINMTMEEFGSKLGYQKATVSKYLSGKLPPSNDFLKKFQEVFNIDLKDFEVKIELKSDKIITAKDLRVDLNNQILINAVKNLQLRFPIAEIQRMTGYGKGSISDFLNNKKPVSDNFLKKFSEAFKIDLNEIGFENELPTVKSEDYSIHDYIKTLHQLLELKDELAVKEKRILFLESEIIRLTKMDIKF